MLLLYSIVPNFAQDVIKVF